MRACQSRWGNCIVEIWLGYPLFFRKNHFLAGFLSIGIVTERDIYRNGHPQTPATIWELWSRFCHVLAKKNPLFRVERVEGIEPSWPAWKAGTLPLSYTRVMEPQAK